MSASQCLQVSELCREISRHLAESRCHKTLVSVATTCKASEGPALEVLWERQSMLTHLLDCLPADALERHQDTVVSTYHLVLGRLA